MLPRRILVAGIIAILGLAAPRSASYSEQVTAPPGLASAQPAQPTAVPSTGRLDPTQFTLADFTGGADIVLSGTSSSYTLYLPVPAEWKITGATLHLSVTYSEALSSLSTLTLQVNNSPVSSLRLRPGNIGLVNWDISVPAELLQGAALNLSFLSYLRLSDDICADVVNQANWARIASTSMVSFAVIPQNYQPELSGLPYPFIRTASLEAAPDQVVLVSPPEASGGELSSALYLASALGSQATWRGIRLTAISTAELTDQVKADYHMILVGRTDRLTLMQDKSLGWPIRINADGSAVAPDGQSISPDTGIVMLVRSPWNAERAVMAVTGGSETAVTKAALAVRQPEFASLARGAYALVTLVPEEATAAAQAPDWNGVSLAALGYTDQVARGLGKHSVRYTFFLPTARFPESLKVNVVLGHSPFVSSDQSYLVLSVNGLPQAATALTKNSERQATWEVSIPASQIQPGKNTLDLLFELHLTDTERCDDYYLDKAWGIIYAGTQLQATFANTMPQVNLSDFPVPFDAGTLVVLPQWLGAHERAAAFQLLTELGAQLGNRAQGLELSSAESLTEEALKGRSVILLGQPAANPWVAAALASAPVQFEGTVRSLRTEHLKLTVMDGEPIGLIESEVSPWDRGFTALILTGTDDQAVGWAGSLLVTEKFRSRLQGDVALIDGHGNLTTLNTRGPALDNGITKRADLTLLVIRIALVLLLTAAAAILIVVLIRRRRARM